MFIHTFRRTPILLTLLAILALSAGAAISAQPAVGQADVQAATDDSDASFRSSPVMFIENAGQWDERVRFQVWGAPAGTMWLAEDAIWITVVERATEDVTGSRVDPLARYDLQHANVQRENVERKAVNIKLSFVGANPHPYIEPFDRLDTVVSYFIGNDPDKWRPDVPVWGGVRYVDLYPGVDLEITSEGGQMMQRLEARPGADLGAVQLRVAGAGDVTADRNALWLNTAAGEFALPLLTADALQVEGLKVQSHSGQAFDVASPFELAEVSRKPPVANPLSVTDNPAELLYSTFLGGSNGDYASSVTVDGAGCAYVTGYTSSTGFPTTNGAFDGTFDSSEDAFVVKSCARNSTLAYATFLGGGYYDQAVSIDVNGDGQAFITGWTNSWNFPTTSGAYDTTTDGHWHDAFVTRLNALGSALVYSTFLGGSNHDESWSIALDGSNQAYISGRTLSSDFPKSAGAFDRTYNGGYGDGFVAKLNSAGSRIVYATFLGGSGSDTGFAIAVDEVGGAYVTGSTDSSNFPSTPSSFDQSLNANSDGFVVKLNGSGSGLLFSTFLGGSGSDRGVAITVDRAGSAYVTGDTGSSDFPTTQGSLDRTFDGDSDGFVAKLNETGSGLVYSTFLGGNASDESAGIAVDGMGSAYVIGGTSSANFPTTVGGFDREFNGGDCYGSPCYDTFVVKLSHTGGALLYGTFVGGGGSENGVGIALDEVGRAYATGRTSSIDFPTTSNAFDRSYNGGEYSADAFVIKLAMGGASTPTPTPTPTRTPTPTITPTPTPLPDLRVDHIEVAQVFVEQSDPISGTPIPLIAQKDTLVRVYVGVSGAASVGGVSARLHIRQPNGTETIDSRPVNVWPVQAKQTPDPYSLQDTVNFRPPTNLLQGNVAFWADVDPANRIPETNEGNNTGGQTTKTFEVGKPLRVAFTFVGYRSSILQEYSYAGWNTATKGDQNLKQVYPVGSGDVKYLYQPGRPEPVTCPVATNGYCAQFFNSLRNFWNRTTREGAWSGGVTPDRMVGWVPGEARASNAVCGEAEPSFSDPARPFYQRHIAVVADDCDKSGLGSVSVSEVVAHEIGHTLSLIQLQHTPNQAPETDAHCFAIPAGIDTSYPQAFPYPRGSILAHGLDLNRSRVLHPDETYDFMTYCKPTWMSPYNYSRLKGGFAAPTSFSVAAGQSSPAATRQLLVSGIVYSPTLNVMLDPAYVINSAIAPDASSGIDYCLELRAGAVSVLDRRCFDLTFVDPESGEPVAEEGFAFAVPYPTGTTQIVLTHLGTPIATRAVSPHAPTVRLISPNGGETWTGSGTHTVTWTASDLDGDPLHFALSYSTDGGASWIPAGLDLTGTQHALDVSMLPGGTSVLLRISATDGVNTTDDVSDAPFTVGRKAPLAFILSPENGAHFFPAQAIWLEGRAFDLEDGTLRDAALRWRSNRDGELGTGKLLVTTLSLGDHVITLTATDSDGAQATATIRLSAGDRVFLPMVLRGQ